MQDLCMILFMFYCPLIHDKEITGARARTLAHQPVIRAKKLIAAPPQQPAICPVRRAQAGCPRTTVARPRG